MPAYNKKRDRWIAVFYSYRGPGKRPKRSIKTFTDQTLAAIHEYKMDIEYYIRKKGFEPHKLTDIEIDAWINAFLKRRTIKKPLDRTRVKIIIANHIKNARDVSSAVNVIDAITNHKNQLIRNAKSPGTINNYESYINRLAPVLAGLDIKTSSDVTRNLPNLLLQAMPDASIRTIDIYTEVIKASLRSANAQPGEWQLIPKLQPKRNTRDLMPLAHIEALIDTAKHHQPHKTVNGFPFWFALFYTLTATTRRVSEITRRKWNDIDPDINVLRVMKQKGSAPPVFCSLNDATLQAILNPSTAIKSGANPTDHIFPGKNGKPINNHTVLDAFKSIASAAGLPKSYSPHHLRHAAITYLELLNPSATTKTLMQFTGHTTTSAYNTYQHAISSLSSSITLPTPQAIRLSLLSLNPTLPTHQTPHPPIPSPQPTRPITTKNQ